METWEEHNLGNDLETARNNLNKVNFEEGINILALQPGVGKTYKIKHYLKDYDKWLITTPTYKLINNEYEEVLRMKGVSYWKGFHRGGCHKYSQGNSYVTNLKDYYDLNPSIICRKSCSSEEKIKCPYKKQFKEINKVIAVSFFYNTHLFYENGKFKFDIAVIDEELTGYEELKLNLEEINKALHTIFAYIGYPEEFPELDYRSDFLKIIEDKNLFSSQYDLEIANLIFYGIEDDQKAAIELVIKEENWKDLKVINKLNVQKLKKWLYYYSIYGEIKDYAEPNIYKIFDLARQGVKVIFSDASFSKKVFNKLFERYKFEDSKISRSELLKRFYNIDKGIETPELSDDFKINLYKSHIQDKNVVIYRMRNPKGYYKKDFDKIVPETRGFIKRVKRKYPNIGIISYEAMQNNFVDLGEYAYFKNLRGLNTFKDKEAFFIIGTYLENPESALKDYNLLFMEDMNKLSNIPKCDNSKELDFEQYSCYLKTSELYQAIHRIRPFENPNKKIFVFGEVIDKIDKEFKVHKLIKSKTEEFFINNYKGVYPRSLVTSLYTYCVNNPSARVSDIAKEFKLYKDSSKKVHNTKFITAVKNGKLNINDVNRINNALLEGINTVKGIKSKYRGLSADTELIEDCINYAKNGDFVILK